jgi:hypothetical protein
VTVSQVGPDVVWSGSGSVNLSNLTFSQDTDGTGFLQPTFAAFQIGPNIIIPISVYSSAISSYPNNFGTNTGYSPSSGSGDTFGVTSFFNPSDLIVPRNYISGSYLSCSMTFINNTIAGLGLIPGTYVWSWGSGGSVTRLVLTINS